MATAFIVAMKNYFGLKPGQGPLQFGKEEVQKLSHEEKMWFAEELRKQGIDCVDPTPPAAEAAKA